MLNVPAPFPYVGSFALLDDHQGTRLVRLVYRKPGFAVVSFPMAEGATGNREVPEAELIDGTPLEAADKRRLADLERLLGPTVGVDGGRRKPRRLNSQRLKALAAERDRLKQRAMYAPILEQRLRDLTKPWVKGKIDRRKEAA